MHKTNFFESSVESVGEFLGSAGLHLWLCPAGRLDAGINTKGDDVDRIKGVIAK